MKKFAKIFVAALIVTLFASFFAIPSSAALVDPRKLTPGSDEVIFIMDIPEGEERLPGDGTGKTPENPYIPIDHEKYDPEIEMPVNYLQTALYQATERLQETGGTIVIMGPVHIKAEHLLGNHSTTSELYTADFGKNTIKFTSVYNGVDYRETNGAKLILEQPTMVGVKGQSIWENIDLVTNGTKRLIAFHCFSTLVGEGVNCYPLEEMYTGVTQQYISLSAGHRWSGWVDQETALVVQSGTYNMICGGIWGVNNTRIYKKADDPSSGLHATNNMDGESSINLILEGTTKVLGAVSGTVYQGSEFSGNVNVTINGGEYACDIFAVGTTGMMNKNGIAQLRINGGDFSNTWTLEPVKVGFTNNPPAGSPLDLSGWTGDTASLAKLYKLAQEAEMKFTSIKLPAGVTEADLLSATDATTAAPVDTNNSENADSNNVNNDGELVIGGDDEPDTAVGVGGNNGGMNIGVIVGIVGGLVAVVCVVVLVVVLSKNKKETK
ncbi:MAG: hypothetical protein IKU45_03110 [Clostridia bacterium]|nr:hypothetical protein [Clostridia bacterium]